MEETIEQAAERIYPYSQTNLSAEQRSAFKAGATWQKQQDEARMVEFKDWCDINAFEIDTRAQHTHTTSELLELFTQASKK